MRVDLARPHAFAAERVGFAYGRYSWRESGGLVLVRHYTPIPDEMYVEDGTVGARIGSDAIRAAMQQTLSNEVCVFHVHEHSWPGVPLFSGTDGRSLSALVPSFRQITPGQAHGGLLLSTDAALVRAWLPDKNSPVESSWVIVVGFPLTLLGVARHG